MSEKIPIKEYLVSLESASRVHYRDIMPAGTHSGVLINFNKFKIAAIHIFQGLYLLKVDYRLTQSQPPTFA